MLRQEETGDVNGWVLYPPLSETEPYSSLYDYAMLPIVELPLFVLILSVGWYLARSRKYVWLAVLVSAVLGACLLRANFHSSKIEDNFFLTSAGGDHVLAQHFFWFLGHPEVYRLLGVALLAIIGIWMLARLLFKKMHVCANNCAWFCFSCLYRLACDLGAAPTNSFRRGNYSSNTPDTKSRLCSECYCAGELFSSYLQVLEGK